MYPTVTEMINEKTALLKEYLKKDAEFEKKTKRTMDDYRESARTYSAITSLKRQIKLMLPTGTELEDLLKD
jgi:hypothetical protein